MDDANCSSRSCSSDVYTAYTCARTCPWYPNVPIDRCVMPSALTVLSAKSDEETSDGLDGQDASRPLFVDGEAVPGGKQAPTQGSGGLVCPLCKVHGELVRFGGVSGAVREGGSNV